MWWSLKKILLFLIAFIPILKINNKLKSNKEKIIYYGIIVVLIAALIYIYDYGFDSIDIYLEAAKGIKPTVLKAIPN